MRIILHADDFGYDMDTCQATIDCFEKGFIKSATIMVNMPATAIALEYAKKHPEYSFGVHLTFVDELFPISKSTDIPSLVKKNGKFLPSEIVRKKALLFRLKRKDIITESISQINILKEYGIPVSHLDSHGHLHKFPSFLSALKQICSETGINKIRRVQNIHLQKKYFGLTIILNALFNKFISKHFKTTDLFYMAANAMDTHWSKALLKQLSFFTNETIEIGVHPGTIEQWRKEEYRDIEEFAENVKSNEKYELISWNQL